MAQPLPAGWLLRATAFPARSIFTDWLRLVAVLSLGERKIEAFVCEHAVPQCFDQGACGRGGALQPAVQELVGAPQPVATPLSLAG